MSAPCQRCPERIRCGVCLSGAQRSEFSRAPLRVLLTREPCVSRARSPGRLFLVTFFGEAKKVTRPPGRIPGLSPRQCNLVASSGQKDRTVALVVETINVKGAPSLRINSGDAIRLHCRHDQAGCSPRRATYFFCFAKRSRQEKATPTVPPRCAGFPCRRYPERGAAKLATLRCAQTDAAPYPLRVPLTRRAQRGFHCNGYFKNNSNYNYNCNRNRNCHRFRTCVRACLPPCIDLQA